MKVERERLVFALVNISLLIAVFFQMSEVYHLRELARHATPQENNTFDYRNIGSVGELVVSITWLEHPMPNALLEIKNHNFETLFLSKTSEEGLATISLSDYRNETYYLKVTATVHFIEGGNETKYLWVIFEANTKSRDTLTVNLALNPAIWNESPTTKIEGK